MDSLKNNNPAPTVILKSDEAENDDDWGDVPVEDISAKRTSNFVVQQAILPNRTTSSSSVMDDGDWDTDFDSTHS